jgi:hypothetical protein
LGTPLDYEPKSSSREQAGDVRREDKIAGCRENFVIALVLIAFVFVFGGCGLFYYLMSDAKPW